jgi:calpain-15
MGWKSGRQGLLESTDIDGAKGAEKALLCIVNGCITPFVLVYYSFNIYLAPCISVYISRFCCWFWCLFCFCGCWLYRDAKFKADDASLGDVEAGKDGVKWKRGNEVIVGTRHAQLFARGVNPNDICQGALGNCWLLSALACLADSDGLIEGAFSSREYNPRGKYTIKLYHPERKAMVSLNVDDRFPTKNNKTMFTSPSGGNQIWVMLMEKAFAKLMGNYAATEGGHVLLALHVITGDPILKYSFYDGKWGKFDIKIDTPKDAKWKCKFLSTEDKSDNDAMFDALKLYKKKSCIMGAGTKGKDDTIADGRGGNDAGGIVPGHAYSILDVRELHGFKLVCLRNPWGSFEWKGDWSDNSAMWNKHPLVKARIWPDTKNDNDGIFWMSWEDFCKNYDTIDVCIKETGMDDLVLKVNESLGQCGTFVGCLVGCFKYWCCCCGLYKLWCGRAADKDLASTKVKPISAPEGDEVDRD